MFKDLGGYDVASAQELAREVEDAISATGVEVRGFYNTEGFKKDADLMVWFYGDAADKVQAAYRALRQSAWASTWSTGTQWPRIFPLI